jgi:hypothetical protein
MLSGALAGHPLTPLLFPFCGTAHVDRRLPLPFFPYLSSLPIVPMSLPVRLSSKRKTRSQTASANANSSPPDGNSQIPSAKRRKRTPAQATATIAATVAAADAMPAVADAAASAAVAEATAGVGQLGDTPVSPPSSSSPSAMVSPPSRAAPLRGSLHTIWAQGMARLSRQLDQLHQELVQMSEEGNSGRRRWVAVGQTDSKHIGQV